MSPNQTDVTTAGVAQVFAALGDANRLSLLARLCDGESHSITQLTQGTGISRQGVSKHLTVMERARVVSKERVGRETRYALQPGTLQQARTYLDRASEQWDDALLRLRSFLEI